MIQEEIQEGNKLIDKFYKEGFTGQETTSYTRPSQLIYHCSWDALIPVIKKIDSGECRILLPMNGIKDSIAPYIIARRGIIRSLLKLELMATFKAVVEFIKWYNEKK